MDALCFAAQCASHRDDGPQVARDLELLVADVAELGADRIVYLSCEPATLARDLALMVRCGYEARPLQAFDLFPQTPHVEALAVLERDPIRRR